MVRPAHHERCFGCVFDGWKLTLMRRAGFKPAPTRVPLRQSAHPTAHPGLSERHLHTFWLRELSFKRPQTGSAGFIVPHDTKLWRGWTLLYFPVEEAAFDNLR